MTQSLADMRRDYTRDGLSEANASGEPFELFRQWFQDAVQTEQPPVEPNAMNLATVDAEGRPHCRVLLLKALDERGFTFFSNYDSAKAEQLGAATEALRGHRERVAAAASASAHPPATAAASISRATRSIPQMGQLPGLPRTICGCMGQT